MKVVCLSKMSMLHAAALLSAVLLLNGCVTQPAVPQDYFYRLPDLQPPESGVKKSFSGLLLVEELQAEGVYRERPLLYVNSQRPLEVLQYHYRHWAQTPTQLIQDSLVEYLRRAHIATRVERNSIGNNPEIVISGRLEKFEQFVQPTGAIAVVAMEVEYRTKTPQGLRTQIKVYENKVKADGPAIHDSVIAFGNALQHIYDNILADLSTMAVE